MRLQVTAQQRANAIEMRDVVWPSIPAGNVLSRLGGWSLGCSRRTHCGTVACGGGWAARWPAFQAQGVTVDEYGIPRLTANPHASAWGVGVVLFGDDGLFEARFLNEKGTDHEVFAKRLNDLIKNSEVVS